jgi:glycosyltransferase involved in cell wall biosynthesis
MALPRPHIVALANEARSSIGTEVPRPLVSAIITTRNRATLLQEALASVLHQEGMGEVFDQETIVVDDASTDATADVIAAYSTVRYICQAERHGPAAARNIGAASSHGQYVAFLDDDDLWLPDKLRRQVRALEAQPEVGAVYSHIIVREDGRERVDPTADAPSGNLFEALLEENVCGGVLRFLIRRAAFEIAGRFDETPVINTGEDYDLWMRLAYHFPIMFLPGPVAVYRPHASGRRATAVATGVRPDRIRYSVEKAIALLPETAEYNALRERARAWAEIRVVKQLANAHDADLVLPEMLEAVRRSPIMLREASVRDDLIRTVRRCSTPDSPLAKAEAVSAALRRASGSAVAEGLRRTVAAIWSDAAIDLVRTSPWPRHAVWSAMGRAVRHDPAYATRRILKSLRRLLRSVRRFLDTPR